MPPSTISYFSHAMNLFQEMAEAMHLRLDTCTYPYGGTSLRIKEHELTSTWKTLQQHPYPTLWAFSLVEKDTSHEAIYYYIQYPHETEASSAFLATESLLKLGQNPKGPQQKASAATHALLKCQPLDQHPQLGSLLAYARLCNLTHSLGHLLASSRARGIFFAPNIKQAHLKASWDTVTHFLLQPHITKIWNQIYPDTQTRLPSIKRGLISIFGNSSDIQASSNCNLYLIWGTSPEQFIISNTTQDMLPVSLQNAVQWDNPLDIYPCLRHVVPR